VSVENWYQKVEQNGRWIQSIYDETGKQICDGFYWNENGTMDSAKICMVPQMVDLIQRVVNAGETGETIESIREAAKYILAKIEQRGRIIA
jgi:hypothetical protein